VAVVLMALAGGFGTVLAQLLSWTIQCQRITYVARGVAGGPSVFGAMMAAMGMLPMRMGARCTSAR
jgi:hypothetical protein